VKKKKEKEEKMREEGSEVFFVFSGLLGFYKKEKN